MSYENWISYRYLKTSKGRFLKFLNFISVAGIAIGVMSLIVVISVMTGFGNNLREKIIGSTPHLMVEKETGIKDYVSLEQDLLAIDGIEATSPYIQGNIFLEQDDQAMALVIRGIDPLKEEKITKIKKHMKQGDYRSLQGNQIVIGSELARFFGFTIGDEITLIAPGSGISGEGWRYNFNVVGVFSTGMDELDLKLAIIDIKKAQELANLEADEVTGIGIKINNPYRADDIKQAISEKVGFSFLVRTWIDNNRGLFEALFLEKLGLFIVLSLMVLIASFNIISTMIVTVTSKVHDIGILKSIGVSNRSIKKIFKRQGIFLGLKGILWGLIFGFGICYILKNYVKVPEDIYYTMGHVPVELRIFDVLAIIIVAYLITYISTIFPAAKAASLQPVDALRYE